MTLNGHDSGILCGAFYEMYGFSPTIYILTRILGSRYPALNPFSHASGHLWLTFFGGGADMMALILIISNGLAFIGFVIMWKGWSLIHGKKSGLVTGGLYAYVRHPQYSGLILVMISMVIQWPTIITALMFPVLLYVYYRLSKREEGEMIELFGEEQEIYGKNSYVYSEVKQDPVQECLNLETPSKNPVCKMTMETRAQMIISMSLR